MRRKGDEIHRLAAHTGYQCRYRTVVAGRVVVENDSPELHDRPIAQKAAFVTAERSFLAATSCEGSFAAAGPT